MGGLWSAAPAAPLDRALDATHLADLLLQLLLGVAVRLVDRPGRFTQVVELAQLVRYARQGLGNSLANRMLPVGDHAGDGDADGVADLGQQLGEVVLTRRQQALGQ